MRGHNVWNAQWAETDPKIYRNDSRRVHIFISKQGHPEYLWHPTRVWEYVRNCCLITGINSIACDFFKRAWDFNQARRYRAARALKHPWITRKEGDAIPKSFHEELIRKLELMDIFRKAQRYFSNNILVQPIKFDVKTQKSRTSSDWDILDQVGDSKSLFIIIESAQFMKVKSLELINHSPRSFMILYFAQVLESRLLCKRI